MPSSSHLQLELDSEKARGDCLSANPRSLGPQPINSTSAFQQRQRRLWLQATLSNNLAYHTSGSKQRWLATIAARSLDHSKDAVDAELEVLSWFKGCPRPKRNLPRESPNACLKVSIQFRQPGLHKQHPSGDATIRLEAVPTPANFFGLVCIQRIADRPLDERLSIYPRSMRGHHQAQPFVMFSVINGSIVRRGGELQAYRPLENFPTLFRIFIKECRSENSVIDFVNKFGPLNTNPGNLITTRVLGLPGFMSAGGDSIGEVIRQAKSMAKLVGGYKSDVPQIPLTSLEAFIATGPIRLKLSPSRLIDAIWLQMAQSITSGRDVQECLHCGELFEVGPGSGRRLDAKFCRDEHRIAFNNRIRSKTS